MWLVAFVVSFFSIYTERRFTLLLGLGSVWTSGLDWILTIGVPTIAVFLIVLRRFSPDGIRRVGSLGIDQFASVAFSVSAVVWLVYAVDERRLRDRRRAMVWIYSWVVWVEFVAHAGRRGPDRRSRRSSRCSARTSAAGREIPAHRNARPLRPVVARPAPEYRPSRALPTSSPTHARG